MIFEKLSQIQKRLFVPKANRNDFGKYNYRSCEDILKTVKPLCEELGCVLLMDSEIRVDNGITHIMATAILHDLEDGSEIKSTAGAREEDSKKGMDGSQISGSSLSYARKYALAGLFCIDNEKDSDATNEHNTISKKEYALLLNLWKEKGGDKGTEEALLKHCKVSCSAEITDVMYAKLMEQLNGK